MDAAYHWPQGIGFVIPMEGSNPMLERRPKPHRDRTLNCPRCNSTDTKFCYFNNYSFSQPRYFCKTCRRYWTQGGSLRNVPVGGGSRKNKKSSSASSSSSSSLTGFSMNLADLNTPSNFPDRHASQNPKIYGDQDLNLAYPPTEINYSIAISNPIHKTPFDSENKTQRHQNTTSSSSSSSSSTITELLKSTTGTTASGGLGSFMAMPPPASTTTSILYPSGFYFQEPKQTLNFSLDGFQKGYGNNLQGSSGSHGARLFFPVEDIKPQVSSTTNDFEQHRGHGESTGYWTRLLSGGSW